MASTASSTRTAPAQAEVASGVVQVRSESRPGLIYEVSADYCPCESFHFGRMRDAQFTCKHIRASFPADAAFPVLHPCGNCNEINVRHHGEWCVSCTRMLEAVSDVNLTGLPDGVCEMCGVPSAGIFCSDECRRQAEAEAHDAACFACDDCTEPVQRSQTYIETMAALRLGQDIWS